MKNTKIIYDKTLKLMTVSPSAWTATGPTQWFCDYRIVTTVDNPLLSKLRMIDLGLYIEPYEILPHTVNTIYSSAAYERMTQALDTQSYIHVLNRASPHHHGDQHVLSNDFAVTSRYENKVWFRERFVDTLHFPDFVIKTISEVMLPDAYNKLAEQLSPTLVVQHAQLGGSKGTYIVRSQSEFIDAIAQLQNEVAGLDERIVISREITDAQERTLQVCITKSDIFVGPAQSQLVRHPLLTSSRAGDIQFCGGRIAYGLMSDEQYQRASQSAHKVGESLKNEGYLGIFGMDFIVRDDEVYTIEANPRMTGLTPLLAFLQTEVPYLLLHILELAGSAYTFDTSMQNGESEGSFIEVYAQTDCQTNLQTGVYTEELQKVGDGFENGSLIPESESEFFVGMRVSSGEPVHCGKSIAFIYSKTQLFDNEGQLSHAAEMIVTEIRKQLIQL